MSYRWNQIKMKLKLTVTETHEPRLKSRNKYIISIDFFTEMLRHVCRDFISNYSVNYTEIEIDIQIIYIMFSLEFMP